MWGLCGRNLEYQFGHFDPYFSYFSRDIDKDAILNPVKISTHRRFMLHWTVGNTFVNEIHTNNLINVLFTSLYLWLN